MEMRSPNALDGSDESGSEDASSEHVDSVTRMADESSEGPDSPKGSVSQTTAVSPAIWLTWYSVLTPLLGSIYC